MLSGAKMIGKLKQMHVLIIGLRGLGVEVAKNLILAGPHSVSVYDEGIVAVEDLGTNFYCQSHANSGHASSGASTTVDCVFHLIVNTA